MIRRCAWWVAFTAAVLGFLLWASSQVGAAPYPPAQTAPSPLPSGHPLPPHHGLASTGSPLLTVLIAMGACLAVGLALVLVCACVQAGRLDDARDVWGGSDD